MDGKNVRRLTMDLIDLLTDDRWMEINGLFSSDAPMNWTDVEKLNSAGVIIGSHCHDHFIVHDNQAHPEIDYQLKTSKELIEQHLGECKYFVYPNGTQKDISLYSITSVQKSGYLLGFSSIPGEVDNQSNPYILPRIHPSSDFGRFKFTVAITTNRDITDGALRH